MTARSTRPTRATLPRTLACAAALAGPALAQDSPAPDGDRPNAAGRVVRLFDFEELQSNPGEVPRDWYRAQDEPGTSQRRPGFPKWNKAELSFRSGGALTHRGEGSSALPTSGGSTVLVLDPGVLPVFQNADYLVSAYVHTRDLSRARAGLIARLMDASGLPIPGGGRMSELVITRDGWQEVKVELSTDLPDAAFLQLELVVLQPRQAEETRRQFAAELAGVEPAPQAADNFRVWEEDRRGAAFFDDVAVVQLPRVELLTQSPGNVVVAPEAPTLNVIVRDLTGEQLGMSLELLDDRGQVVDSSRSDLISGVTQSQWKPQVVRYGWYRARLALLNTVGTPVGGQVVDFVWLPAPGVASVTGSRAGGADAPRFGIAVRRMPDTLAQALPEISLRTGAGSLSLPAWSADLTTQTADARPRLLLPLVSKLLASWRDVTISLAPMPDELASGARLDPDNVWGLLRSDVGLWRPYSEALFEKLGQRVSRWQLGLPDEDRAFWDGGLSQARNAVAAQVPGPVVTVPTDIRHRWDVPTLLRQRFPVRLLARVGADVPASSVRVAVDGWREVVNAKPDDLGAGFVFDPGSESSLGMVAPAQAVARKAVECWRLLGTDLRSGTSPDVSLWLEDPWRWSLSRRPNPCPTPMLALWRNLADRLTDRRIIGALPAGDGLVCYILAPVEGAEPKGGAIVAWTEGEVSENSEFASPLGVGPLERVDLFGNRSPIALAAESTGSSPLCRVALSAEPVFIEGVDTNLVRFLASVRIEDPFLDLHGDVQERFVVVSNPWTVNATGNLSVLEPGGFSTGERDRNWRISPRSMPFTLAPGQEERIPLSIAFAGSEEAGTKPFIFSLDVVAEERHARMQVRRAVELGLHDFRADMAATPLSGDDLAIEATITNTSTRPLTLEVTCLAPGHPRAKATIIALQPGKQAVRRFAYQNAATSLRGQRVLATIVEPESAIRLSKGFNVP